MVSFTVWIQTALLASREILLPHVSKRFSSRLRFISSSPRTLECFGAKKCVIEEADHQRILSAFARRALAAHSNGAPRVNLPKSESNVTFLSDRNPLTTHNPVYDDNSHLDSPDIYTGRKHPANNRFSFSAPYSEWSGCAWTMPARIHAEADEAPRRQLLMDASDWELQILRAAVRHGQRTDSCGGQPLSGSFETKMSVREQARQFEEQALLQNSHGSPSPIHIRDHDGTNVPELSSDDLLSILECPSTFGLDVPPNIIVTQGDESWSLSKPRSTPPVLGRFGSNIANYVTVEPCQIHVEIIPDPPEIPPPPIPVRPPSPPSPSTSSSPDPPSFTPSPPDVRKPNGTNRASPPPTHKELVPPPPPPPLPPPPSPSIDQISPVVQFVPTSLPAVSSLRPVSERKLRPPTVSSRAETGKRELKGILKNLQNLVDIERSVANLYSQVDKNCKVPKFNKKAQVTGADKQQDSDLSAEQSTPKPNSRSASLRSCSSVNYAESQPNVAAEIQGSDVAELSEPASSQTTVF
ncbi:protocadherin-15-like [Syngnathus typhle]